MSTTEACGIPSLSQDARTHYCAHAYAHTYAHAQSQACAFHEHANDSCQQNARSIENICGAASTPIRIQEACGIPLQSGCMHALLYARTCTHICTCARPSLLRLRALFVPCGRDICAKTKPNIGPTTPPPAQMVWSVPAAGHPWYQTPAALRGTPNNALFSRTRCSEVASR